MHRTQTKRITLAVLCALPLVSQAEEGASTQEGIKLKPERSLLSLPPERDESVPVFIEADRLRGHSEKETEAEGNVQLRRSGQSVFADRLRFESPQQELEASGNVRLEQQGDVLRGEYLRFNLGTERGFMDKPVFKLTPIPSNPAPAVPARPGSVAGLGPLSPPRPGELESRGDADRMRFLGPDLYRLEQASYTTCGPGNDDWFIRAHELDIDKNRDVGVARGASIVFMDQAIFYTPYISFPLHQQRKSGFLAPHYGTASTTGTEFTQPYYWNIAPNLDATFSPRVMTKRGLQLGTEFRYLEPSYRGEARVEILPGDREAGRDRWGYFLKHTQTFANGWSGALNLNRVSDANYFTDLSTLISLTSQATLPNEATLSRGGTWGQGSYSFSALGQKWQTLQNDPLAPITPPYNRLPQLTWSGFRQDILKSDLDVQSSFVAFNHPTLVNGQRVLAYPSLSLPLQTSYAYFTPKVGMHATHYFVGANDQGYQSQTRTLPIFTADTGLIFDRETRFLGRAYNQTLEPKLYYVYIPYRDQSRIPNFESGLQDVSFATIFSENQFSGSDRINDANQVTVGVTSRFIEPETGVERLRVALAQRYYFAGQRVTLPGVLPRPDHTNSSDLLAGVSATILPKWTVETGWQYTTDTNQTQKANFATRYQPAARKVLNLAYRSDTPNLIKQTDMSFQWPVTSQWTAVGRWNYSIQDKRTLEALAGFEYDAGCWQFRAVAHRFATALSAASTSFFLQLELNGVSRIGSNPLDVLRRNIGGYTPHDPRTPRTDEYFVP
ncbi:MAG: LPS-assembly protein LptD [Burkholderiales bacterium]